MLDQHQSAESGQLGDITILRLSGELDTYRAPHARRAFADVAASGLAVVDLTEVPFIDSAGLGALIGGIRRIRERSGDVAVFGAQPQVCRMLRRTGVDRFVRLESTLQEAIAALAHAGANRI